MQAHERVTAAIRTANEAGRTAVVPFITAGYPEPGDFLSTLQAVAAAGDVVEIGIPFSDPMADGMTIQRSSFTALQKGVSVAWIFGELDKAGGEFEAPLVMMSYLNPLLAFGYDRLAERALASGVCGFIVPDLPYEESEELRTALDAKGLGLVQLVTPATPDTRLKLLCDESRGFVYAVTITGITQEPLPSGPSEHGATSLVLASFKWQKWVRGRPLERLLLWISCASPVLGGPNGGPKGTQTETSDGGVEA